MTINLRHHRPLRRRPLVAALAAVLAASAASAGSPRVDAMEPGDHRGASTIVVTNCEDSGPGSLRDAYAGATDGDFVELAQLSCSTITLSGPLTSHPSPGYVSIIGNLDVRITIDGNNAGRVFEFNTTLL